MKPAHQNGVSFASHRFKSAIPEAHVKEVLVDTLRETIVVTAALHCAQHSVHPAKVTILCYKKSPCRYPSEKRQGLDTRTSYIQGRPR
jgi:hypothetical protein